MTQLIAAICENGNKVTTASDRMVSTGDMTLAFEHPRMKAIPITQKAIVLTAETVHEPDLLRQAKEQREREYQKRSSQTKHGKRNSGSAPATDSQANRLISYDEHR